jgi:preprotein translocase subunit SecG
MYALITVIILIAAILLILIVLVQNSKGGGLASGFSSSNQIMGVRKTTDFLEKATWTLAGTIIVLCIVICSVLPKHAQSNRSAIEQQVNDAPLVDPNVGTPDFATEQPSAPEGEQEETPVN